MTAQYQRHPQLAGRIVDELAFVVTANNKLQTLNSTATRIWELVATPKACGDIANALVEEFEVTYDVALSDVQECVEDLVRRNILISV